MFFRKSTGTASRKNRRSRKQHSLRLETLEDRQLLSVNISEVHFNPKFGNPIEDQYLELRAEPNTTVPNDLYFLSVESDGDEGSDNPGKINAIFSLGGLSSGANGYMAFIQQDAAFSVDSEASVFEGTTGGFKGMPGDIYQGFTGQFESLSGSESFLIVENVSGSAPLLSSDIDTNDDGVVDPSLNWNVIDSVTYFKEGTFSPISGDVAYGDIVFRANNNNSTVPGTATLVDLEEAGYVARLLDSTGSEVDDWVAGATKESISPGVFEVSDGDNGVPSPAYFAGKRLDHVGAENFFTSVSGTAGVNYTIFVDRNNNGFINDYVYSAEPDDPPPTSQLISAFSGVTLLGAGPDHESTGASITSANTGSSDSSTGDYSFSYQGITAFSDLFQMRMEFAEPTGLVNLDFTGGSNQGTAIGVLKAFDVDGNVVGMYTTSPVARGVTETMSVSAADTISYAVAYVDPTSDRKSGFLDNLQFLLDEEEAVTASDGTYKIVPVWEHDDAIIVRSVPTGAAEGVVTNELPATHVDFALLPEQREDIFGRSPDDGTLHVVRNNILAGNSLIYEEWGNMSPNATWETILVGDFNGDSRDDVLGRTSDGQLWVTASDGASFTSEYWGKWSGTATWEDVVVGDFDGDGTDDLAGRTNGQWWLARSQGSFFTVEYWGNWSNSVTWEDVVVGDFDGDGKDDIAGRTSGQWWISHSQGTFFSVEYWGNWSNSVTWDDVAAGDFNGDGRTDIAGRTNGSWWISNSQGTFFTVEYWGNWSNSVTWEDVLVADVNGDGQSDIVGRANGTWWVSRSQGTFFSVENWGNWSNSVTWDQVLIADINADTMDDIIGVASDTWWITVSQGSFFTVQNWGNEPGSSAWENVQQGDFGNANGGSGFSASSIVVSNTSISEIPILQADDSDDEEEGAQPSVAIQSVQAAYRARRSSRFE